MISRHAFTFLMALSAEYLLSFLCWSGGQRENQVRWAQIHGAAFSLNDHLCIQAYWERTVETSLQVLVRRAGLVWSVWLPVSSDWCVSSQTSPGPSFASGRLSLPGPDGDQTQPADKAANKLKWLRCQKAFIQLRTDPELSGERRLILAADGVAVGEGVKRRRFQVSLQFLQSCFSPILRLTAVHWLAGQQEDALLTPARCLRRKWWQKLLEWIPSRMAWMLKKSSAGFVLTLVPSPERGGAPSPWAGGSSCSSEWSWSPHTPLSARCTSAWWSPRHSGSSLSACRLHRPGTEHGPVRPIKTEKM